MHPSHYRCTHHNKPEYFAAHMANPLVASSDIVVHLEGFVDDQQYLWFALVSTSWTNAWRRRPKLTRLVMPHTMVP